MPQQVQRLRAEVERLRAENDRLRAENDRLQALVTQISTRYQRMKRIVVDTAAFLIDTMKANAREAKKDQSDHFKAMIAFTLVLGEKVIKQLLPETGSSYLEKHFPGAKIWSDSDEEPRPEPSDDGTEPEQEHVNYALVL